MFVVEFEISVDKHEKYWTDFWNFKLFQLAFGELFIPDIHLRHTDATEVFEMK